MPSPSLKTFLLIIDDRNPQDPRIAIVELGTLPEPLELSRVEARDWISAKAALGFPLSLTDERRLRGEIDDWSPQVLW